MKEIPIRKLPKAIKIAKVYWNIGHEIVDVHCI
jgi:hypothetical protein